ncbi:MAG: Trans-aconitate 2-methyltransferase [Verrucomicrobiae bacterium]|nr:Trans-aconitate 2-methyltransferase [Verrucomicrobiae bacterium]
MKLNFYPRIYAWLLKHRPLVFTAVALLTVGGFFLSTRLDLEEDILDMLPRHDQQVDEYRYALGKFRQIDRVYIDVGTATDDPDTLEHAADEVYTRLAANPDFGRITYRVEMTGQAQVLQFLTGAVPNLFTEADAQTLAGKLSPPAVREHLTRMRRRLTGVEGMVLKDVVAADPVGMSDLVIAKVVPLQTGFGESHVQAGRIMSQDGRHVLLTAEPRFPSADSRASASLVQALTQISAEVERQFPGIHVAITGGHRMAVDNATIIRRDATRCISIGVAAMLVLCFATYRRRWLAPLTFLPSLFGTLMAGVVLALWQEHLSAIALGFASIAVGITVDYAIHVIYHLEDTDSDDPRHIGEHLGRLVFPITVGVITTLAAFAVMLSSPIHGYQQLGTLGIIGVVFSAGFAVVILPLLVPAARPAGGRVVELTKWWENYFAWESRRRWWLVGGVVVLTVALGLGLGRLRFEGDIAKLNGVTPATQRDDELIQQVWGGALGMTMVVVRGETPAAALAANDRALATLTGHPNVAAVYSLAAICPAPATQRENVARWQKFWTADRQAELRATLATVGAELGFRAGAFDKFWQGVEHEPAPFTLDLFRGTPLETALNERAALGTNDHAISTLVKLKNRSAVTQLRTELPGAIILDGVGLAEHIAEMARTGLTRFAVWSGIVVAALLLLSLASLELTVITLLPLAFGLCWTFGLMGWLGLPINLMNSIFVIFVIGVGEDYSVFLVTSKLAEWRGHKSQTAANSASVLVSALTTIFGFGVMVLAQHPVLFSMGTTVLIGMAFAFLATLIIVPAGMDLLLFKDPPRGAPRWWHLLGTLWGATHLFLGQLMLWSLRPFVTRDRSRRMTQWATRGLVKAFPFGKLEWLNCEVATFARPAVLISNHQSAVDVLIIKALAGNIRMTIKKRVWDTPILGLTAKMNGDIVVDTDTTLTRCRQAVQEGASVHFFVEGTRSLAGDLQRFRLGAFQLAIETRQDIAPILLCDTNTAMPRDAYWFEPYRAVVRALPRVTPQNFDYNRGARELAKHCEQLMRAALQAELDRINTPATLRRKITRLYRYQGKWVEQFVYWKMRCDPLFAVLNHNVPRQGFILDLGCGYGMASHWLAYSGLDRQLLGVDYDADKIRVAQRSAPRHDRVRFEQGDLLTWAYPACDTVLLFDVLHYWTPDKQEFILKKARQTLRPGGRLILRDAARAKSKEHEHVTFWEKFATRIGHNKTLEGLHFQSEAELRAMLMRAGFTDIQVAPTSDRDSNVLITAGVARQFASAQIP